MSYTGHDQLSRRERQIMDIIYAAGQATAGDVHQRLPDPPSYSAVRALLRVLEDKGHLTHVRKGLRYEYRPTVHRDTARLSALRHLVQTLFDGSAEEAMVALLDQSRSQLSDAELDRLSRMIDEARKQGR